jgi:hypothetical protein
MGKTKVEKLLEDIGQLKSLKVLELARQLKNFKMLELAKCKQLKTLPESFGCLEQLEHLDMFENPCL